MFVKKLIKNLFDVEAGVYAKVNFLADSLIISRTGIVRYLIENVGLKKGNKIMVIGTSAGVSIGGLIIEV